MDHMVRVQFFLVVIGFLRNVTGADSDDSWVSGKLAHLIHLLPVAAGPHKACISLS